MLMLSILMARRWRTNRSICLFALLMLCGCAYLTAALFGPLVRMDGLWWIHDIGSNALPGVFWLVCLSVFSDRSKLGAWHYILASLTLLIPLTATLLQLLFAFDLHDFAAWNSLVIYVAMVLELALIVHAIVIAVVHWRSDLVQQRRYMRGGVIAVAAVYIFLVIVIEQLLNMEWVWLASFKYAGLVLIMLGIYKSALALRHDGLFATRLGWTGNDRGAQGASARELQKIQDAMTVEHLYRHEGMTIAALARHLSIREYKLRQLINGEMGYRNFNDFLNHYRIKEVAARLEDPEHQDATVLHLALDSGFRSLSSFNRAFRCNQGMTPTEYRNRTRNQQA